MAIVLRTFMKSIKTASVEQLQLISRFETLHRMLLDEQYARHLERPLAYWALPADRRLPLAFLGRTLQDLLDTPYSELAATPGIGQKKMRSFVKLLARAADTDAGELPGDLALPPENGNPASSRGPAADGFDPAAISEMVWVQWRRSAIEHGFGKEPLGRLAPSLKNMTRVIWTTPLEAYADKTLAEIRAMKTHGEKRVRAILEVFHGVHAVTSQMGKQEHLVVRIVPQLIDSVETWIGRALQRPGIPSEEEIFVSFVNVLLKQIRRDASRQIVHLAENRLGIHGPVTSVRQAARGLCLTRARIYQLLNEINDIITVRWPLGRHQVYELHDKFQSELENMDQPPNLEQFHAAIELFYPASRRGAAGRVQSSANAAGAEEALGEEGDSERATASESSAESAASGLLTG
jgi:hypothetical protein